MRPFPTPEKERELSRSPALGLARVVRTTKRAHSSASRSCASESCFAYMAESVSAAQPSSSTKKKMGRKVASRLLPPSASSASGSRIRCGFLLRLRGWLSCRFARTRQEELHCCSMKAALASHSPLFAQLAQSLSRSRYDGSSHAAPHAENMYCGLRMHSPALAHPSQSLVPECARSRRSPASRFFSASLACSSALWAALAPPPSLRACASTSAS
mmetsp:Transcript_39411/g.126629  ORF Transcript_39411/g.126629 Transcript_39411/m.126629 type:complete len:215 (+) Transcript_39411:1080-1724(+)